MAFEEDFAGYFVEVGDDATLAGVSVRVIFDGPGGTFLGMAIEQPSVQLQSSQVPASYRDAALVITTGRGTGSYKVREHTPDGTGMSLLTLQVAP